MNEPSGELYAILGIDAKATPADIRVAYLRRAHELHPDLNRSHRDTDIQFKRLRQAYEILSKPNLRARYDARPERFLSEVGWGDRPLRRPIVTPCRAAATDRAGGAWAMRIRSVVDRRATREFSFFIASLFLAATVAAGILFLAVTEWRWYEQAAGQRSVTLSTGASSVSSEAAKRSVADEDLGAPRVPSLSGGTEAQKGDVRVPAPAGSDRAFASQWTRAARLEPHRSSVAGDIRDDLSLPWPVDIPAVPLPSPPQMPMCVPLLSIEESLTAWIDGWQSKAVPHYPISAPPPGDGPTDWDRLLPRGEFKLDEPLPSTVMWSPEPWEHNALLSADHAKLGDPPAEPDLLPLHSALRIPHSAFSAQDSSPTPNPLSPHSALRIPHSALWAQDPSPTPNPLSPHSALRTPHSAFSVQDLSPTPNLLSPHSALRTPHSAFSAQDSSPTPNLLSPHSAFRIPHSAFSAPYARPTAGSFTVTGILQQRAALAQALQMTFYPIGHAAVPYELAPGNAGQFSTVPSTTVGTGLFSPGQPMR